MHYQFDWAVLLQYRGILLDGLVATIELAVVGGIVSMILGVMIALGRIFMPKRISWLFACLTEIVRNVPPLVQFFVWYFGVGLDVPIAAVVALSVFHAPYIAELVRSGVNAVPHTQWEASRSAGMSGFQAAVYVVLPQAFIRIVPLLSSEFIGILKDTSIAMTIGYTELTFQTQEIETETFRGFEAATAVTILYILLASVIVVAMHGVERWVRLDVKRG
jgi:polar amino acid transport system permease protein